VGTDNNIGTISFGIGIDRPKSFDQILLKIVIFEKLPLPKHVIKLENFEKLIIEY